MSDQLYTNWQAEDLNGDCFIVGSEGEPERDLPINHYVFPSTWPANNTPRAPVAVDQALAKTFVSVNAEHLIRLGVETSVAIRLGYIRFLVARNGLVHPAFDAAAYYVKYTNAVMLDAATTKALDDAFVARENIGNTITASLPADVMARCRELLTDMICCVAYIFRVRGHHYTREYQERYETLWNRCLHQNDPIPVSWEMFATVGIHAIYPAILDDHWIDSADNAKCAGTLVKRLDAAPAGSAGVFALDRGIADINMIFPQIGERTPDAYAEFQRIKAELSNTRWGGSINCRFYGTQRIRVNEGKIGALASVVKGIYDTMAEGSQLMNSAALRRLAEAAPATGGALGILARRTVQSEAMLLTNE